MKLPFFVILARLDVEAGESGDPEYSLLPNEVNKTSRHGGIVSERSADKIGFYTRYFLEPRFPPSRE